MSFPHICDETKRSLSFLRPPEVISDYTNNYQDRTTRTFLLKCPTKSKRSECGKIGRLNITMSKNPDYMGEQLNNTVFLISFKCASCKEYMDLANDRFDPGSCNSVILGKSGLGKTNISSFQFDKIRGKFLLSYQYHQACYPYGTVASFVSSKGSFLHNFSEEQSLIRSMVRYDWYDALKDSNERGKGFHVDQPITLSFYFVNKFDHSYGLVNLKEAYDRDRENHSDRYIESNDIVELQSGVQVEVPHGQNQDIETMSQSMSDSLLYADTAESSATNPWRRWFGSPNTAESFDPRRAPLSSASLRFAPQVPRPSTLTLRSPVDLSGQHELPYNPSSEIHEVPGDYERVTDSQGGGYFDPNQNPFEQ